MRIGRSEATQNGRFVHLRENPQGTLDLVLTETGRRDLRSVEAMRDRFGNHPALKLLLADHLESGWELVPPRDLGAWTSCPILSREIERNLDGTVVGVGRVYCQFDYPVVDVVDQLRTTGFVEFQGAS